jgi:hypothetical protein
MGDSADDAADTPASPNSVAAASAADAAAADADADSENKAVEDTLIAMVAPYLEQLSLGSVAGFCSGYCLKQVDYRM